MRFLDRLTREPLPEGTFVVSFGEREISEALWSDLTEAEWAQAAIRFLPGSPKTLAHMPPPVNARDCSTDIPGLFLVPYFSRLTISLDLASDQQPEVDLLLLSTDWLNDYRAGRIDRGEETLLPLTSIEHMLQIYLRDHRVDDPGDADGVPAALPWVRCALDEFAEAQKVIVGGVTCLVRVYSDDYGLTFTFADLIPGESTLIRLRPPLRPLVIGQLLDWEGKGVPRQAITTLVSLGKHYEEVEWYGSREYGALATFGQPGDYHRRVSIPSITDEQGNFSVRVPRGEAYAVESKYQGAYAFEVTRRALSGLEESIQLRPQLKRSNLGEGVPVRVINERGEPVPGIFVELAIADDFPWFRSLPILPTDADGWAGFPWIGVGTTVAPGLFAQQDRWAQPALWRAQAIRLDSGQIPLILRVPDLDLDHQD